jgi:signal peptidase II
LILYEENKLIIWIAIIVGVVAFDQVSKLLIVNFLDKNEPFVIINGIFRFNYVENRGAAFGSFADNRWVFMIISTVAIIGIGVYLFGFC